MADADPLLAFSAHISEADPALSASFLAEYEDPEVGLLDQCYRCGATVTDAAWDVHTTWHRTLSLAMYVLGSTMNGLVRSGQLEEDHG